MIKFLTTVAVLGLAGATYATAEPRESEILDRVHRGSGPNHLVRQVTEMNVPCPTELRYESAAREDVLSYPWLPEDGTITWLAVEDGSGLTISKYSSDNDWTISVVETYEGAVFTPFCKIYFIDWGIINEVPSTQ